MNIPIPVKGEPMRASWGEALTRRVNEITLIGGYGGLCRESPQGFGTTPLPVNHRNRRGPAVPERPWELSSVKDEDGDEHVVVYLPGGSLVFDGEIISVTDIDGVTPVEGKENHYQLDVPDASASYLVVLKAFNGNDEEDYETDHEEEVDIAFSIALAASDEESDEDILATVPIGRIELHDDKGGKKAIGLIEQLSVGTIVLERGPAKPDEDSIDRNGGEDGENKLQIAHFNDTARDSTEGLVTHLEVDTETGVVSAKDCDGLMLVCRKDGKVVYIPLANAGEHHGGGNTEGGGEADPCPHPGDEGGVPSGGVDGGEEEESGGVSGGGGGGGHAGDSSPCR